MREKAMPRRSKKDPIAMRLQVLGSMMILTSGI